jgi:tetratricopeptide (TPR) repeat protein
VAEIVNFTFGSLPTVIFFASRNTESADVAGSPTPAGHIELIATDAADGQVLWSAGAAGPESPNAEAVPGTFGEDYSQWEASFRFSSLPGVTFYAALATQAPVDSSVESVEATVAKRLTVVGARDRGGDILVAKEFPLQLSRDRVANLLASAEGYVSRGDLDAAERLWRRIVEMAPGSSAALEAMGRLAETSASAGDVDRALALWREVMEMAPGSPAALEATGRLADTLESVGQLDEAEQIRKGGIREAGSRESQATNAAPDEAADGAAEAPAPEEEPPKSDREREHVSWLDDDPVDIKADELGRQGVARALEDQLRTLVKDYPRRSFLVHIDGPWGAGKSTLMRFVQERVVDTSNASGTWLVVSYDAWRQAKAGPPWLTLLEAIRTAVRADKGTRRARISFWLQERARLVARWQWIAAALIVAALLSLVSLFFYATGNFTLTKGGDVAKLAGGLLSVIAALWVLASSLGRFATLDSRRAAKTFIDSRADPMEDLATHFRWVLAEGGRTVMLLIDDLDRCPEAHVVEILETVQKLLRDHSTNSSSVVKKLVPSLIILVAADGRWIRASYDNVYASLAKAVNDPGASIGSLFLQKLFQLTVPVPRLSDALKAQYIADLLAANRTASGPTRNKAGASLVDRIDKARSSEEILGVLASVSQVERIKVADQAIQRLVVEPDAQARTRHVLEPFAALVDPTPRSLKRYMMAYSMLRAVRTAEGSVVNVRPLALWTVLIIRWPMLGDYLQRFPESVELFKTRDERALKDLPPELVSLFTDPPEELRRVMNHAAGPLDARRIRECSGQ